MKAMRKEDFESEVDYIYALVEVLKDFSKPQQDALMLTAIRYKDEEVNADEMYEHYQIVLEVCRMCRDIYEKVVSQNRDGLVKIQFDEKER